MIIHSKSFIQRASYAVNGIRYAPRGYFALQNTPRK
jgi:hypothetical protein